MSTKYFEVLLGSLSNRLDVAYYLARSEVEKQFGSISGTELGNLVKPLKTKTPAAEEYVDEGIPCIKLRNITGKIMNTTNCDYISDRLLSRYVIARKYDIIITATGEGTAGRADIFIDKNLFIVTGENILLRPDINKINPFYLLAMLRTDCVAKQLKCFVRGATGQTHLYWQDISNIRIPDAPPKIQKNFKAIFLKAWGKRCLASKKILRAKQEIIKVAGLEKFDYKRRDLIFETTFSSINHSLRFDVEYHQPVYTELKNILKKMNCESAKKKVILNNDTINPNKYPTNIFYYLDISSIDLDIGDYETSTFYGHQAPTRARKQPKLFDVVVSTVRPNRNAAAIILNDSNLVISTGFAVITPTSIKPFVFFAIIKTEPIFAQVVRKATAAMYPAVRENDILDILIPNLSIDQEMLVERNIKKSISLRKESDSLLDKFKKDAENIILNSQVASFKPMNVIGR